MLVALLAYPGAWYLLLVPAWLLSIGTPEYGKVIPPWTAVPASLVYSAWGIFFTGWFVLPIGGLAGGVLAWLLRKEQVQT